MLIYRSRSLQMDHPSFTSANGSPCSMAEIWPFGITGSGVVGGSGGVLGAKRGLSGHNLGEIGSRKRDVSVDESIVTEQSRRSGGRKRRNASASEEDSSKLVSTSSGNDMNYRDAKCLKGSGSGDENGDSKPEIEASSGVSEKPAKQSAQSSEPPKQDYIHVRARRGQATDSHSLAERARREKISERMKILQDLVPGCNKVIGKALVLDEIINYIQSLQHQVEFMSMKLEAVNSRVHPSIDQFPSKDFITQTFGTGSMEFGLQASREYDQGSAPEWLHMQVGGSFDRASP